MIFILNTKNNNGAKIALTTVGALALGLVATGATANADTTIDSNHVQVEAGDTLSAIAQKHGTDVDTLVRENHIANKHLIYVGDKLVVMPGVKNTNLNGQETGNPVVTPTSDQQTTTNNDTPVTQQAPAASGVSSNSAKEAIAQKESSGSYTATNGKYIGRYQLDASYLNGDYSIANQEKVADQYVAQRYGSWDAALAFHNAHGWY